MVIFPKLGQKFSVQIQNAFVRLAMCTLELHCIFCGVTLWVLKSKVDSHCSLKCYGMPSFESI